MSDRILDQLAMVFPGQGSQSVGMLAQLADTFPIVIDTFSEASRALNYDLWKRVQEGPEELLNQTACTQPAMLTAGVALWRCWQQQTDSLPAMMAGHSLGEYTALVCAGSMDFTDAVKLVEQRGIEMQQAVPEGLGAMAAILGLDDKQVLALCVQAGQGDVVSPVNYNSPGQVVIAGHSDAVERAMILAREAGAKRALKLPVSVPSHCELMQPAAKRFAEALEQTDIRKPVLTVLHNVDVESHESADEIRSALIQQIYKPVRWVEIIRVMADRHIKLVFEMGPGKVLAALNKRIDKQQTAIAVMDADSLEKALETVAADS